MDAPEKSTKSAHKLDGLGKFASGLCAVHCALCAFLPGLFALIGLEILVGHEAEWGFTIVAIVFALGAMVLGFQRHRSPRIAALFAMGILGLLGRAFLKKWKAMMAMAKASSTLRERSHAKRISTQMRKDTPTKRGTTTITAWA